MATGSLVIVSPEGFSKASGELLSLALVVKSLVPRLDSLADMAARVQCSEEAGAISRLGPVANSVDSSLRTLAVALRERARWAEIAARYPEVRQHLDLLLNGRHGFDFLMMSALGDANGLRQMAAQWHLTSGNSLLDPEIAALTELAKVRGDRRFNELTKLVDKMIAANAKALLTSSDFNEWSPAEVSKVLTTLTGFVANQGASAALKWVFGSNIAPGTQVANGIIGGLLELWKNSNNPYLTEEQKRQRALAVGATSFAVGGVAVAGGAICIVATAGLGALACLGAVGLVAAGANTGFTNLVHAKYPEDRQISLKEFQGITNEAREEARLNFLDGYLRKYDATTGANAVAPQSTPAWFAEYERLDKLHRQQAADLFYEQTRYPPRDKVDEYLIEEEDRANWHVKMAEISLNN